MSTADLILRLRADADQAVREMGRVEGATEKMGLVGKAAMAAVAYGATRMAAQSLDAFAEFDTGMREVFTLMPGISADAMGRMTDDVRGFAVEFGLATEDVTGALYQAISAGISSNEVMGFMETAAQTARGGVTDLATAVDGLTTVMNAYRASGMTASDASDTLFTAMRLGKTTIGEMSDFLYQVVPVAAAANVTFSQVASALVAMTLQGTPTRVASTYIKQAMVELGKEGSVAFAAFEHAAGQTFPEFMAAGGDVGAAMSLLSDYAAGTGTTVQNMFGSIEGGLAATVLASQSGAAAFSDALGQMASDAGATQDAFNMMSEGAGFDMDQMRAALEAASLTIGESLMPIVQALIPVMEDLLPPIADLAEPLADALLPVVEAIVPLLEDLVPLFELLGEVIGGLAPLIQTAANVLGPVVDLITAVVEPLEWLTDLLSDYALTVEEVNEVNQKQAEYVDLVRESIDAGAVGIEGYARILQDEFGYSAEQATQIIRNLYAEHEREVEAADAAAQKAEDLGEAWGSAAGQMDFAERTAANLTAVTVSMAGAEQAMAAAFEHTGPAAMAVYAAEQTLANLRLAALDPMYAAILAEQELADASDEVARLKRIGATGTDEYRDALLDQLAAQAKLDAAHGSMLENETQTRLAITLLGEELGWTAEQTATLIGFVETFNTVDIDPGGGLENQILQLRDALGLTEAEARALLVALGLLPSSLTGGITGGGLGNVTARQHGGPVMPGRAYMVGEDGPEVFSTTMIGHIFPTTTMSGHAIPTPFGLAAADVTAVPASPTLVSAPTMVAIQGQVWAIDDLAAEIEARLARAAARGASSLLIGGGR